MITLYHLEKSRSFRILWLLEELKASYGLSYQVVDFKRNNETFLAPKALADIHPMGKAPILTDDALGETALAESAVIIEYLLKAYDKNAIFYPPTYHADGTPNKTWLDYEFWLHFAEGSLMPPLVMTLILSKASEKSPFLVRPIIEKVRHKIGAMILNDNIKKALKLIDDTLRDKQYLCGEFTGADVQLYFAAAAARQRGAFSDSVYPNIAKWLAQCENRPAYKQTVAIGGAVF